MRKLTQADWKVRFQMLEDPRVPFTIADVMEKYGWTYGKAKRCLDRLVENGIIRQRVYSFWNGMYYAKRFYYW